MGLEALLVEAQRRGFLGPTPVGRQLEHSHDLIGALAPLIGEFAGQVPRPRVRRRASGSRVRRAVSPMRRGCCWTHSAKRCEFLRERVGRAGLRRPMLGGVGRAEELARRTDLRGSFDLVVARAFGPPATTAECAVGFLSVGGRLAVSEPPAESAARPAEQPAGRPSAPTGSVAAGSAGRARAAGPRLRPPAGSRSRGDDVGDTGVDRWPRRVGVPRNAPSGPEPRPTAASRETWCSTWNIPSLDAILRVSRETSLTPTMSWLTMCPSGGLLAWMVDGRRHARSAAEATAFWSTPERAGPR